MQAKSSGIKLPEVHGIDKGLDPNVQAEKQVIKPIAVTNQKEVSQIKSRCCQRRVGLRCKIKTLIPTSMNKPIKQAMEKQPKFLVPKTSKIQDKVVPISNYTIPHAKSKDDSGSSMVERKAIQHVSREIPIYLIQFNRPPCKPVKIPIPKIPGSLSDIDPELNTNFVKVQNLWLWHQCKGA